LLLAAGATVLVPAAAALVDLRGVSSLFAARRAGYGVDLRHGWYFIGRRFGRHKLAPSIIPGRPGRASPERWRQSGSNALAWAYLGSALAWIGPMRVAPAWILPVLLGLAVAGIIGDLFESLIKRQAGVKDSGTLLPGHGGMLDRNRCTLAMLPLALLAS